MLHVVIPFLHGGCASTAVTPLEVFKTAGVFWNLFHGEKPRPCFEVLTVSADGGPVRADAGLQMTPQFRAADVETPDLLFIPAGGLHFEVLRESGYDIEAVLKANEAIVPFIRRWHAEGAQIAAVCAGVALAAVAGVLDGKIATAHWGLTSLYKKRFPTVDFRPELLVTESAGVYCGGGVNAASDLALYLVEKFAGHDIAAQTARALLLEMPRTWQSAFSDFSIDAPQDDPSIGKALAWLHENFANPVRVDELAKRTNMTTRTFSRRFKSATSQTPLSYLHGVRINAAKRLLEDERRSIQEVMIEVGYEDAIFFRDLFKRHTGELPASYRERFGKMRMTAAKEMSQAAPKRRGISDVAYGA